MLSGGVLGALATTWLGIVAALWTLLAPPRAGDGAGAAIAVALAATALAAWAGWRWRQQWLALVGIGLGVRVGAGAGIGGAAGGVAGSAGGAVRGGEPTAPSSSPVGHAPARALGAALDRDAVLVAARAAFLRLQAAWDAGDVAALGRDTTAEMLDELLPILAARTQPTSRTDVVTLHAELLGVDELGAAWLATVEFSGLIREAPERGATRFRELWMLAAAKDEPAAWRLARQQPLL